MKKLVFFLVLLSFIFTVKAGYVVRGVFLSTEPNGLTNYTLTFDGSGNHVYVFKQKFTEVKLGFIDF